MNSCLYQGVLRHRRLHFRHALIQHLLFRAVGNPARNPLAHDAAELLQPPGRLFRHVGLRPRPFGADIIAQAFINPLVHRH